MADGTLTKFSDLMLYHISVRWARMPYFRTTMRGPIVPGLWTTSYNGMVFSDLSGLQYLRQMGQNAIFQDNNARPHRARIVDNFLQLNGVQRLEWPPMSPDLSCIEHLWDILGRAVNKHINQRTRLADLQRLLLQEWAAIPQRQIQRLVNSMRRIPNECRVNLGGYTHY